MAITLNLEEWRLRQAAWSLLAGVASVKSGSVSKPLLNELYARYLDDENTAAFIGAVSQRYLIGTLERLASAGSVVTRRAATLAISYVGQYDSNGVLGRALHDHDRCVRLIAENGIRELWQRDGTPAQQERLKVIVRQNASQQFKAAAAAATALIEEAPWFAEAWNQRGIARFHCDAYTESADDCQQTLELNPYHFAAAVGLAHCYLQLDDVFAALESFRRALQLNPDMEEIRIQVEHLERMLEGK
jgi:tetratricopeptide (TPR) repeat protein